MDANRDIKFKHKRGVTESGTFAEDDSTVVKSLEITASSIYDRPMVAITNVQSGETYTIPVDFMHHIDKMGAEAFYEYQRNREVKQYKTNHPSDLASVEVYIPIGKELQNVNRISSSLPRDYYLVGQDSKDEITPIMRWVSGKFSDERKETIPPHWTLSLVGAPTSILQKVNWDNASGMKSMVESSKDPDTLLTMLALTDAAESQRISSQRAAVGLKTNKNLPEITLREIKQLLTNHQLTAHSNASKGRVGILTIKSEGRKIPVGIMIEPTDNPRFALNTRREKEAVIPHAEWRAKMTSEEAANAIEWHVRFARSLASTDFRIVTVGSRIEYANRVLITSLAPGVWSKIAISAGLAYDNMRNLVVQH